MAKPNIRTRKTPSTASTSSNALIPSPSTPSGRPIRIRKFKFFPKFPFEIREMIWAFAEPEPEIVTDEKVRKTGPDLPPWDNPRWIDTTREYRCRQVPPLLHVCHESRRMYLGNGFRHPTRGHVTYRLVQLAYPIYFAFDYDILYFIDELWNALDVEGKHKLICENAQNIAVRVRPHDLPDDLSDPMRIDEAEDKYFSKMSNLKKIIFLQKQRQGRNCFLWRKTGAKKDVSRRFVRIVKEQLGEAYKDLEKEFVDFHWFEDQTKILLPK